MNGKTILILVNKQTTIINFRLEVVSALINFGYTVYVSVPDGDRLCEIEDVGAYIIRTPMDKESTSPVHDFKLFLKYRELIRQTRADVVLTYTIKPNVYGGMAASSLKVPYIANITGLGMAIEKGGIMRWFACLLYRIGFRNISTVFFQNRENMRFFETKNIAVGKHKLLPGSGVNLEKFHTLAYPPDGNVEFAFISRIRREKGIEQYIDAARVITKKYPCTRFHVCGFGDSNYEIQMKQLHEEGIIIYHGLLNDVRDILKDIHCVVHPTYYPEGMSNVLLESAASGRPVISTNRAGCREIIDDRKNGYLIREKDSNDLINSIEEFIGLSYHEKHQMGINGRLKVEKEFDRQIVTEKYLQEIERIWMDTKEL